MGTQVHPIIQSEILKIENRRFWFHLLGVSTGYLLLTLWLNSIRATASLWLIWSLIIIQFALYFSIFIFSYKRSEVFGLDKTVSAILFLVLAVLGRVNDWEVAIIPALILVMLILSTRNKNISDAARATLSRERDRNIASR